MKKKGNLCYPYMVWQKLFRIMRLTIILLLAGMMHVTASVYSQTTKLNVDARNQKIVDVLRIIENQSDFRFFYKNEQIDANRIVNVDAENRTIKEILENLFEETNVTYKFLEDKLILLSVKGSVEKSSSSFQEQQQQQQQSISGKVSDNKGEPLPGVTVIIKGTTQGTVTNSDGNYTIANIPENAILVFSFIGMKSTEISTSGKSIVDVVLLNETIGLEEVVAIGYGVQKKSVVTGAISGISAKELENKPIYKVEQALQGRTSGLTVMASSGEPGATSTIRIRGTTSINNSDPLYVIDGVPVEVSNSNIDFINPSDIESIEVLKDAASAAIYGARAAAGVILVTTKRGKVGTLNVNYSGYYGVQSPWNKVDLLNADQYSTIMNEARANSGLDPLVTASSIGKGTDWQEELFNRSAMVQNQELSIMGGSEKNTFFTSFGYFEQEGIVASEISKYKRFNFRINSDFKFNDWIKAGESISYSYIRNLAGSGGLLNTAANIDPITPVVITDSNVANNAPYSAFNVIRNENGNPYGISEYISFDNPVASINNRLGNYNYQHNIISNFFLELEPIKDLKIRSSFGATMEFVGNESFTPIYYLNAQSRNDVTSYTRSNGTIFNWNWENIISYSKSFGNHNLTALMGTGNYVYNIGKDINLTYYDIPATTFDEASMNFSVAGNNRVGVGSEQIEHKLNSVYGRVIYDYKEKYMFTAIIRRDGSSRFGPNNKYGVFPSFSLGWVPSQEEFWPENSFINFMKFRGSYGVTGTDHIADFKYVSTVSSGRNYPFGYDSFYIGNNTDSPANPDLKWEETSQLNFGIETTILNDFRLTFDWFDKKTTGMLLPIQTPEYMGLIQQAIGNIASMYNRGVEFELGYRKKIGQVNLDLSGNLSYVENEVTDLGETEFISGATIFAGAYEITRSSVGNPFNSFYGFETNGVFQNEAEVAAYVNNTGQMYQPDAQPGDYKWVDLDDDGAITSDDRTFIANSMPKWTYGFMASVDYKGFDLYLFGQGSGGNKVFNAVRRVDYPTGNYQVNILDRWHGEGTSNTHSRVTIGDTNGNYERPHTQQLYDASYFRIKTVQLGYTFPDYVSSKIGAQKIRVYVGANNLLTFTKYWGWDPEIGGSASDMGIDRGTYPQARSFMLGLNLNF